MKKRVLVVVAALVSAAIVAIALVSLFGGGETSRTDLHVDEIDEAVAAVAAASGRPPRFFEINATPELINLFLDDGNGNAINFVWRNGKLDEGTEAASADGTSFDASAMKFTDEVYANVSRELPGSLVRAFTITADGPGGQVLNRVVVQSERGGQFGVLVGPQGKILGSDPLTGP